jgi:hypothetical protein
MCPRLPRTPLHSLVSPLGGCCRLHRVARARFVGRLPGLRIAVPEVIQLRDRLGPAVACRQRARWLSPLTITCRPRMTHGYESNDRSLSSMARMPIHFFRARACPSRGSSSISRRAGLRVREWQVRSSAQAPPLQNCSGRPGFLVLLEPGPRLPGLGSSVLQPFPLQSLRVEQGEVATQPVAAKGVHASAIREFDHSLNLEVTVGENVRAHRVPRSSLMFRARP